MPGSSRRFREPCSTEAIYLQTETQVISRSRVEGRITAAQFNRALAALEARYPILRACVEHGHFVERAVTAATEARFVAAAEAEAQALYEELLETKLDLARNLCGVSVIHASDSFEIFLLTSHAVTDATSLIELHAYLIHLCDCVVRGEQPEIVAQEFPDAIDDAVAHCLALIQPSLAPPATAIDAAGPWLHLPVRGPGSGGRRHRLARLEIAAPAMHALVDTAHAHHVTVHSLLVAAFAAAVRDLSDVPGDAILTRASVDLRRRLEPHLSTELVFSAITAHVTPILDMDRPLFAIAAEVHEDIAAGTADGRIFRDYENYPRNFADRSDVPAAFNISDMGVVRFHLPTTALRPVGFEYATGWLKTYPNISITVFDGALVATIVFIEDYVATDVVARLAALVPAKLRACAGAAADG